MFEPRVTPLEHVVGQEVKVLGSVRANLIACVARQVWPLSFSHQPLCWAYPKTTVPSCTNQPLTILNPAVAPRRYKRLIRIFLNCTMLEAALCLPVFLLTPP